MYSIRKSGSTRHRKREEIRNNKGGNQLKNYKPCYESYRMNKEMGYYHPNFKENVIIESKYITSERLKTCVREGDSRGVLRILDDGFIPLDRCVCCSETDIQISIYNDHFKIFKMLLEVSTPIIMNKAIANTVTRLENRKYMTAFLKKAGKFDTDILKNSFFKELTVEELDEYREDLLFLQEHGASLSYLLRYGCGEPQLIRNLIHMGASLDEHIHYNQKKNKLSFREIIRKGPPPPLSLELIYRSCYGLNTDSYSWKEYKSIINLDYWKQFAGYMSFPEHFQLDEQYGTKKIIQEMEKIDIDVLLNIYSYF